jgi:hypothetical protein
LTRTGQEPTVSPRASASVKWVSASSSRPSSTAAAPAANGAFAGSTTLTTPRIAASTRTALPSPLAKARLAELPTNTTENSLIATSSATATTGAE